MAYSLLISYEKFFVSQKKGLELGSSEGEAHLRDSRMESVMFDRRTGLYTTNLNRDSVNSVDLENGGEMADFWDDEKSAALHLKDEQMQRAQSQSQRAQSETDRLSKKTLPTPSTTASSKPRAAPAA